MKWAIIFFLLLAIGLLPSTSHAVYLLSDLNSTITINDPSWPGEATNWTVDGVGQMYEQGFWFRTGQDELQEKLGNYFDPELSSDPDAGDSTAHLYYSGLRPSLNIDIQYALTGGLPGSGTADLMETIRFINTSATAYTISFFQYSDFDLGGTFWDDRLWFENAHSVQQIDLGGSAQFSETVVTPPADHHEGARFSSTLANLNTVPGYVLNDLPPIGGGSIEGDVTWAFQWDFTISPNSTVLISKDKNLRLVPEPGTLLLMGLGILGGGALLWRRRA